jgi:hypothetical protein
MFIQHRVLRRTFGPKKEEGTSWRNLNNEELHHLYSSPNIIMVKTRTMRCPRHVASTGG